jgi:hypothetical protein
MQSLEGFSCLGLIPNPAVPLLQELLAQVSPIAWCQKFEPHGVTSQVARPLLGTFDQGGTDPLSALVEIRHEYAELADPVVHEVYVYCADDPAVDLGQDQYLVSET